MRRKIVLIVIIGAIVFAGRGVGAKQDEPRVVLPRLTPSPSPSPTPVPTPKPKPPPKPEESKPDNSGHGRRVVYSNPKQRVWLIDSAGKVIGTWLVSGRKDIPSGGGYSVFSRSRYTRSMDGRYQMEYMVRFAHGRSADIGFHAIPVDDNGNPAQSESELGTYQSAGCVRQKESDAIKMWDFAQIDTKVVVIY
jgi:lipoprotein-anchoring transpeptidase ErfK/SrfK